MIISHENQRYLSMGSEITDKNVAQQIDFVRKVSSF